MEKGGKLIHVFSLVGIHAEIPKDQVHVWQEACYALLLAQAFHLQYGETFLLYTESEWADELGPKDLRTFL